MKTIEDLYDEYKREEGKKHIVTDSSGRSFTISESEWKVQLEKEVIKLLPDYQRLAIILHSKLCTSNHSDQCGFYYEVNGIIHDWNGHTHKRYVERAKNVIQAAKDKVDIDTIIDIIQAI